MRKIGRFIMLICAYGAAWGCQGGIYVFEPETKLRIPLKLVKPWRQDVPVVAMLPRDRNASSKESLEFEKAYVRQFFDCGTDTRGSIPINSTLVLAHNSRRTWYVGAERLNWKLISTGIFPNKRSALYNSKSGNLLTPPCPAFLKDIFLFGEGVSLITVGGEGGALEVFPRSGNWSIKSKPRQMITAWKASGDGYLAVIRIPLEADRVVDIAADNSGNHMVILLERSKFQVHSLLGLMAAIAGHPESDFMYEAVELDLNSGEVLRSPVTGLGRKQAIVARLVVERSSIP